MNKKYQEIWHLATYYLSKGINKNFVLHTEGVVKAMNLIIKKEKSNPDILIPAAILHDVGWSEVPKKYQQSTNKNIKLKGMQLHIAYAPKIIRSVLRSLHYKTSEINKIINIVVAHKFCKPRKLDKQLLIDADQLSDSFKEQFYSDAKAYKITPKKLYNFRIKDNHFYTKTAENIFKKEMKKRLSEIS